mmetsp:Transcript_32457/g.69949  ORF Transcript_32457/g.69949 Transcript_32457/m.69949 type:complete len:396 (-) Transcript_32457:289-1476(-)
MLSEPSRRKGDALPGQLLLLLLLHRQVRVPAEGELQVLPPRAAGEQTQRLRCQRPGHGVREEERGGGGQRDLHQGQRGQPAHVRGHLHESGACVRTAEAHRGGRAALPGHLEDALQQGPLLLGQVRLPQRVHGARAAQARQARRGRQDAVPRHPPQPSQPALLVQRRLRLRGTRQLGEQQARQQQPPGGRGAAGRDCGAEGLPAPGQHAAQQGAEALRQEGRRCTCSHMLGEATDSGAAAAVCAGAGGRGQCSAEGAGGGARDTHAHPEGDQRGRGQSDRGGEGAQEAGVHRQQEGAAGEPAGAVGHAEAGSRQRAQRARRRYGQEEASQGGRSGGGRGCGRQTHARHVGGGRGQQQAQSGPEQRRGRLSTGCRRHAATALLQAQGEGGGGGGGG